jgi:hypothetical protein
MLQGMYGELMITRSDALQIQRLSLDAISALSRALDVAQQGASAETLPELKRGVGLAIGIIETELLSVLNRLHPDIDDLRV